ncbi:hypothetical protein [Afipia sp. GAS231]|uniref:hypothetical protein n=1 Tax=Afipia sp. GAS231 TaxID=1882747 RepID=UPI00087CDD4B|nr:hypothetical protein [Afipia sp. GAS231]SDO48326.1 hypothetical protein SAMN05444050_4247 [Afipia sp. GAS231]
MSPSSNLSIKVRAKRTLSGHITEPAEFDLQQLKDGRPPAAGVRGHSGRPRLAEQIVSAMRGRLTLKKKDRSKSWKRGISYFWNALDRIEQADPSIGKVVDVLDIPGAVWHAFTDHLDDDESIANKSQIYIDCAAAVTAACAALGRTIELPANSHDTLLPSERRSVEVPYSSTVDDAITVAFRSERQRTQRRFEDAHRFADSSQLAPEVLIGLFAKDKRTHPNRAEALSRENVLRFIRDEALPWLPNPGQFEQRYGFQPRKIGHPPDVISAKLEEMENPVTGVRRDAGSGLGLAALYRWFVPHLFDLVPIINEIVHTTGLNLGPVLDIDRFNWFRGNVENGTVTVFSRKARARGEVVEEDSSTTDPDGIYAIIKSAIEITEPLHRFVEKEIARLKAAPRSPDTQQAIDKLTPLRKRVWLWLGLKRIGVNDIDTENDPFHEIAHEILRRHNVREHGEAVKWGGRRVRDGFAEGVHVATKFSPEALQKKLKHKRVGTSAKYLKQPAIAGRECRMIGERVSLLMDDPKTRAAHWPSRAEKEPVVATGRPRTTILVMPGSRQWLAAAGADNSLAGLINDRAKGSSK